MRVWVSASVVATLFAGSACAEAVDRSARPSIKPVTSPEAVQLVAAPLARSLRPTARSVTAKPEVIEVTADSKRFDSWLANFRSTAMSHGLRPDVLDRAFRSVTYDADVIRRDRNQSEFTKTIWEYLDSAASDTRIANGKAALAKHETKLNAIEAKYGVEKEVVLAIWGLESAYGAFRGNNNVIRSLATLSFDARRTGFFEGQLIAALKILQNGDVSPENMTGSWAGAMGHTQFMPTSYQAYAVDFTGDGKRDIWSEDPSDALASTAAYLKNFGWTTGQPWGVEVRLPKGFDYTLAKRSTKKSPDDWARMGVVAPGGRAVPNHGQASILLPAGGQGAAFMIFDNFAVIERYNTADAYVIGVGHLSDRIAGGGPIKADWPRGDRALTYKERQELQRLLTARGFDTQGVDGKIGPLTIAAVRAFQVNKGLLPDGYPSLTLLQKLR
ncbi:lytic murein transglycosylase [Arenibacterium sp. CAU 1754]